MHRRHHLDGIMWVGVLLFVCGLAHPDIPVAPNIVVIVSDDAGYAEFGYTGATTFSTPCIDRFAATGIRFTNGYVTSAICSPSRAGLLTGLYPQRFGYEHSPSLHPANRQGLPPSIPTVMEHLKALGYATGVIGKWHLGVVDGRDCPLDRGADEFFGFLGGHRDYWGGETAAHKVIRRGRVSVESAWGQEGDPADRDPTHGRYLTDAFADEGVDFIARHAPAPHPFFLLLSLPAPHSPYQAKRQDRAEFPELIGIRQARSAMMYALDRAVGRTLDALDEHGARERTIVVFVNDNGGLDEFADNGRFRGGKGDMYEGGLRVPFLMRVPGAIGNRDVDEPVSTLDILPTLLSAAGGAAAGLDGRNLLPHLLTAEPMPPRILWWRQFEEFAVRDGPWKLVQVRPPGVPITRSLFNLAVDPEETLDHYDLRPDVVAELEGVLTTWEMELAKPSWGRGGALDTNAFDHFRFGGVPDRSGTASWRGETTWFESTTMRRVQLTTRDAYANTILEFPATGSASVCDMARMSRLPFMLNEMRFSYRRPMNRAAGSGVSVSGNPLLLTKTTDGRHPALRLMRDVANEPDDKWDRGGPRRSDLLIAEIANELQLHDDLTVTGAGALFLAGDVVETRGGRSLTNLGPGQTVVTGRVAIGGALTVSGGSMRFAGGRLTAARRVDIQPSAALWLESAGAITADVAEVDGTLGGDGTVTARVLVRGELHPGPAVAATGTLAVIGSVETAPGSLVVIDFDWTTIGTTHDQLVVKGPIALAGRLGIRPAGGFVPAPGDAFAIICAETISGSFDEVVAPPGFAIVYGPHAVVAVYGQGVTPYLGAGCPPGCIGDVNGDWSVTFLDLSMVLSAWGSCGASCPADLDHDGVVGLLDLLEVLSGWGVCASP